MEKDSKTENKKKKQKWRRSPLQDLNLISKCSTKSTSFSSSSSMSISSNSSSFSSSSRTALHKKTKLSSKISNPVPKATLLRSKPTKENDLPRPSSQKSKKIPPLVSRNQPASQKSNLLKKSALGVKNQKEGKNGSGMQIQFLDVDSNLTSFENSTPVGKLDHTCCNGENSNTISSNSTIKTPPIEASVSPDIQCGISSVMVSAATPCYAAGHVLSGVSDKRKCRPRGILTIGGGTTVDSSERENASSVDRNVVVNKSSRRGSLIPLPAEAEMHWLLSPCRENNNDVSEGDSVSDFRMFTGSATSDLPYSTSTCSGVATDLVCNRGKYSDSINKDVKRSGGKARVVLLSPGSPELRDSLSDKMGRNLFPASPLDISCCNDVNVPDEWKCSCSLVRENSPCSTASLSSGNVIQTPKSDPSSGKCGGFSWLQSGDHGDNLASELDSVAEFLQKTRLSPRNQISSWDPHHMHFKLTNTSWVSDSTLDNVSQSQMRISWRDGIVSRTFEMDDLDCCRCLSDAEDESYCYAAAKKNVGVQSSGPEENDLLPESVLRSPEILEHKHKLSRNGKLKSSSPEANLCAESILTEGGGLVSSADSDWNLCYKNQLYRV